MIQAVLFFAFLVLFDLFLRDILCIFVARFFADVVVCFCCWGFAENKFEIKLAGIKKGFYLCSPKRNRGFLIFFVLYGLKVGRSGFIFEI